MRHGYRQNPDRHSGGFQAALFALLAAGNACLAQPVLGQDNSGLQRCVAMPDSQPDAKLRCYNDWAAARTTPAAPAESALAGRAAPDAPSAPDPTTRADNTCHDVAKPIVLRQFDLRHDSGCPRLTLRGWRPTSLGIVGSTSVNTAPYSPTPGHVSPYTPYQRNETRLQVSVRTKLADDLLVRNGNSDSVWFGYTAQSYWQLFNGAISRPFRNTDHEPEVYYVHPLDTDTAAGWHQRFAGVGVVHQSNGQSLPLSRSWNRSYLMAGLENTVPGSTTQLAGTRTRFSLYGRVWQRWRENAASDDNPDISDYVGRAEVQAMWYPDEKLQNIVSLTLRHSLRGTANGSYRLEWMNRLDSAAQSAMYTHFSMFSGYGDSLLDYNRRRTVFTLGLSLLDW